MKYLIFIDLDGTLLNSNSDISDFTKEGIKIISNLGHKVILSTGRCYKSTINIYEKLELNTPIICDNGAHISFPNDNTFDTQFFFFEKEVTKKLFNIFSKYEFGAFVSNNTEMCVVGNTYEKYLYLFPDNEKNHFNYSSIEYIVSGNVNTILLFISFNDYLLLKNELDNINDDSISYRVWDDLDFICVVEIYLKGIDKSFGVKILKEHYNISNTIGFGDGYNDLEMLLSVDYPVVMKKCSEILIKNNLTPSEYSNSNDGVVKYLLKFFNITNN